MISVFQPPPTCPSEADRDRAAASLDGVSGGDPVLDALVSATARRLEAEVCLLSVLRGDAQRVLAAHGMTTGIYARRQSFCGHAVAADRDLFCVPDLSADPRFAGNPWVDDDLGALRFYAAALVRDSAGRAVGALCVADDTPRLGLAPEQGEALEQAAADAMRRLDAMRG